MGRPTDAVLRSTRGSLVSYNDNEPLDDINFSESASEKKVYTINERWVKLLFQTHLRIEVPVARGLAAKPAELIN